MVNKTQIMEYTQVTCCGGNHVGIIDHMEGEDHIKLAKSDPESGDQHHLMPLILGQRSQEKQGDTFQNQR